jgi:hypothetical protein
MEILEKQDPEKRRLMNEAKKHKQNLSKDVQLVSEQTEKMVTNALIIGGALALTYFLISELGAKRKRKKSKSVKLVTQSPSESNDSEEAEESNSILAQIGTKIANEATVFLLNLAKEKLNEYLHANKKADIEGGN